MAKFNPEAHVMYIKQGNANLPYLEVKYRILWFRSEYPNGVISTEIIELDHDVEVEKDKYVWIEEKKRKIMLPTKAKGRAVVRATVSNGVGGVATGLKIETGVDFPDFLEKSETGAIGRALAALGFGTQFVGVEFDEGERIVDAPAQEHPVAAKQAPKAMGPEFASTTQIHAIQKLSQARGVLVSEDLSKMSFETAKALIGSLQAQPKRSPSTMGQVAAIEGYQQRLDLPSDRSALEQMSFEDAAKLKDELKSKYNAKVVAEKEPMGFQQRKSPAKQDILDARLNGSRNFKEQCLLNN